jgi:hypothetical protein
MVLKQTEENGAKSEERRAKDRSRSYVERWQAVTHIEPSFNAKNRRGALLTIFVWHSSTGRQAASRRKLDPGFDRFRYVLMGYLWLHAKYLHLPGDSGTVDWDGCSGNFVTIHEIL